jgi:anaerobic magnesium-protoporphyrin IX monomethyl ester cyclase
LTIDILLVNPLFLSRDPVEQRLMTPYFPLGLLYLASTLRQSGYSVAIYDGMFQDGPAHLHHALNQLQPTIVGIGVLSTVRASALELAVIAHARGCTVVVGGADPTARPGSYLEHRHDDAYVVDLVVVGEGEETILELMPILLDRPEALALSAVRGLAYRDADGRTVQTAPRPLRKDVDQIPFPARDMIDLEAYRRAWSSRHGYWSLSVITSRGCPYTCAWCQKGVFGKSFRPRSPKAVAEEIGQIKVRYRPDQLRIVDDVMGINRRWVKAWRDTLLERDAVIPFECLSRVDLVDRELLGWLKDAGCVRISFGAESGSQKVLDAMAKGTKVAEIHEAAQLCHELGIEVYFYIMVGYPGETWADIEATARLLRETVPDEFSSTIAYPLPGTPFYDQVRDRLIAAADWRHTAENRTLYRGQYSTRFYRWVQRWLRKEWQAARIQSGVAPAPGLIARVRLLLGGWLTRLAVGVLRHIPADARPVPSTPPGH